jgi:hypothetical protein
MERKQTPYGMYIPQAIVKANMLQGGYYVVHGERGNMLAWKPTIVQCMLLIMHWKRHGHCESWHIDNLFIFNRIEF